MSFCTAINCMDGRTQLPVNAYMRAHCRVDYVDTITEAGIVRLLAEEPFSDIVEATLTSVRISLKEHGSQCVAIVAHHDCAGNPVSEQQQRRQLDLAVRFLASHFPHTEILGLWVGPDWQVERTFHLNP